MLETLLKAIETQGITIVLVIFFVWWGYKREKGLVKHIREVEAYQKNELTALITNTTVQLEKSDQVIKNNTEMIGKFCDQFKLKRHNDTSDNVFITRNDG